MTATDDTAMLEAALGGMDLLRSDAIVGVQSLSGGISCDVWHVTLSSGREIVVKRALPALRVTADWRAPVERSSTEAAWLRLVAKLNQNWVPVVLGEDPTRHLLAMDYLPPERHPLWKAELAAGRVSTGFAAEAGAALARIHASTAGSEATARAFAHDDQFHALRLEPYLLFTAAKHPDLAGQITALANGVARSRIALMQGDISPKNILCGPHGPVFLDAETACYGDPAFDLAFCLNHLLLKGVWHPEHAQAYRAAFTALAEAYARGVDWKDAADTDARTAALLPALLLARVDGKSPVEYLTADSDKHFVRETARTLLKQQPGSLDELLSRWTDYFAGSR